MFAQMDNLDKDLCTHHVHSLNFLLSYGQFLFVTLGK